MRKLLIILSVFIFSYGAYSQHFTHDVGVFAGLSTIQTDYGQRGDFASSYSNGSLSFSVAHYLNFFKRNLQWNSENELYNYISLKTELNFITNNTFQHHGRWIQSNNTDLARQLRAMTGEISMFSLGVSLEYHFNSLEEFMYPYSEEDWSPYFTFGFSYSAYSNNINSELGDWMQDITVLPRKYREPGAIAPRSGGAFSFRMGLGTRYKLTDKLDLAAHFNWQYFFSDAIDGLQADVIENKNNEWLLNFQFGIIYHLNYNYPLFDW